MLMAANDHGPSGSRRWALPAAGGREGAATLFLLRTDLLVPICFSLYRLCSIHPSECQLLLDNWKFWAVYAVGACWLCDLMQGDRVVSGPLTVVLSVSTPDWRGMKCSSSLAHQFMNPGQGLYLLRRRNVFSFPPRCDMLFKSDTSKVRIAQMNIFF